MDASAPIFCPTCDYNLAGLSETRCPECGDAFDAAQLRRATRIARFGARRKLWPVLALPACSWLFAGGMIGAGRVGSDTVAAGFALATLITVPITFILGLYIAHRLGRTLALLALGRGWLTADRAALRSGAWIGGLVLFAVQVLPVLVAGITVLVLIVRSELR